MVLRIVLAALVCMICACAGAQAQVRGEVISAYNQAVQSGDADGTLRAATALAEAAMANPGDERAALLAFEAGWKLCEAGRCEAAIAPAEFALAQPAGEGHPGPAQRKLLLAYARWKRDQDRSTRRALDKALDPLLNAEPSMVSAAGGSIIAPKLPPRIWSRSACSSAKPGPLQVSCRSSRPTKSVR